MRTGPKDGPRTLEVTFLSPTLPHRDCHSGSRLPEDTLPVPTRVKLTTTALRGAKYAILTTRRSNGGPSSERVNF